MNNLEEIGSEFWCVERQAIYSLRGQTYLSGRAALTAIIIDMKRRRVRSVCLPEYCCESMIEPFLRQGFEISFYSVWHDADGIKLSIDRGQNCDAVLLINYFGFMGKMVKMLIHKCHQARKIVILDQTHAVFRETDNYGADYIFGSYRKWTGVDIGFAYARDREKLPSWDLTVNGAKYLLLRKQARRIKAQFVAGGYRDEKLRKKQLALFSKAEKLLDWDYLSDTDDENKALVVALNKDYIEEKRRGNAKIIYDYFKHKQLKLCRPLFYELPKDTIPLTVPVMVAEGKRDSLSTYLREHGMFCPIHWPLSSLHRVTNEALAIYRREISLICDQRYTISNMLQMLEVVKEWEKIQYV